MSQDSTQGLTPQEDKQLQDILKKWADTGGGPFANETFRWIALASPQVCVLTVFLRKNGNTVETLLTPRPANDPVWSGMSNIPGSVIRHADFFRPDGNPFNGPLERIQKGELGYTFEKEPKYVGLYPQLTKRGPEIAFVYLVRISGEIPLPADAKWKDINKLEDDPTLIPTEIPRIKMAVQRFQS